MSNPVTCRLAQNNERGLITDFLDTHWGSRHPLIHCTDFFEHYYMPRGQLQFALAFSENELCAVAGYILANERKAPDIWVSIWCAKKGYNGAGLELMAALPKLTGARVMACNNIRPKTIAFYTFLGYTADRLPHYYRLGDTDTFQVAKIAQAERLPVSPGKPLEPLPTEEALRAVLQPNETLSPHKDLWYLTRRYYHFPRQSYDVWHLDGRILVTRTVDVEGRRVLRVVDYIGPAEDFPLLGFGIDLLMKEQNIEYADCYCAGISAEQMAQAGWSERKEDCPNIIPNYLTPPLYENTEYYYFTSNSEHFMMFKADGDQDRPNITA